MPNLVLSAGIAAALIATSVVAWNGRQTAPMSSDVAGPSRSQIVAPPPLQRLPGRLMLAAEQRAQASTAAGFAESPLSLLRIKEQMRYGDFVWNDNQIPSGPVFIRVDLRTQVMSVFRAGHEIGTTLVLYGADSKQTPTGRFPILWKGKNHRSSLYDAPMPYTLRLTNDGIAIHGSNVRWGAATHGCLGIPKEFARRLFDEAAVGAPVMIVRSSLPT